MTPPQALEILEFWLGPDWRQGALAAPYTQQWFIKDPALDAALEERFGALLEAGGRGDLDGWAATPEGRLALVILLDQFTRNTRRDTAAMYANDARAWALAEAGLDQGDGAALGFPAVAFLAMPLMHAEDLAAQERCVAVLKATAAGLEGEAKEMCNNMVHFGVLHRDIVARFGRFPHRNDILERASTPEEVEFLKEPHSSF